MDFILILLIAFGALLLIGHLLFSSLQQDERYKWIARGFALMIVSYFVYYGSKLIG